MPIRSVKASEGVHPSNGWILRLSFIDENGREAYVYNPRHRNEGQIEHRLADNEELLGVYGIYRKDKY